MHMAGRAPYGARGLKLERAVGVEPAHSRAPYGARGLKYPLHSAAYDLVAVAPRMGRVD